MTEHQLSHIGTQLSRGDESLEAEFGGFSANSSAPKECRSFDAMLKSGDLWLAAPGVFSEGSSCVRKQIDRVPPHKTALPFGIEAIDNLLPHNGLLYGTLHEWRSADASCTPRLIIQHLIVQELLLKTQHSSTEIQSIHAQWGVAPLSERLVVWLGNEPPPPPHSAAAERST